MKRAFLSIIFIIIFNSSAYAVGHTGIDGNCYFVLVSSPEPTQSSQYGYYVGGTSTLLGVPGVAKTGSTQYSSSVSGLWSRTTSYVYKWTGTSWLNAENLWTGQNINATIRNALLSISDGSTLPPSPPLDFCAPENPCLLKKDQVNYDLKQYDDPNSPPVAGNVCYEDCQQSAEILWNDCLAGSCVASIKYTATGESCGVETSVEGLQTEEPTRCTDEINEKIAQCGGSLKVLSFDFETCTGECTPDACGDQWTELVNRCGGIMAVSSWNAETCSGSCVNDPVPDPEDPESEAVPEDVTKETVTNSDGTSTVTTTTTYNVDNVEYTKTTVTNYDAEGNVTGTSTSTSTGHSDDSKDESFNSIPGSTGTSEAYAPSSNPYDIPTRFNTFLTTVKSSSLFSFSTSFFESLPSGGSSVYAIDAGRYGNHTVDLSDTMSTGLSILKSILLACFGFLSIRAVIMKR